MEASTSAFSRATLRRWNYYSLTGMMFPGPRALFHWTLKQTEPITTGTRSCRELARTEFYGYRIHGPFDPANGMRFDGKELRWRVSDRTIFTAYEMLIGTPAYMSPGQ